MSQPAKEKRKPHASTLRTGRWSETFGCYAITKCPRIREPALAQNAPAELILSSLDHLRKTGLIRLLAFCIMPDHYHVLMFLTSNTPLSDLIRSVGKYTARRLNQMFNRSGQFWEEGFYDHRCRSEEEIEDRMCYIEHNAVRAELVEKAEDWPYSSAHPSQARLLDRDWYAEMK
jgi:REP element-mobilizing transposase RayT